MKENVNGIFVGKFPEKVFALSESVTVFRPFFEYILINNKIQHHILW